MQNVGFSPSHVLAIRLYCLELEASCDLLRGKFYTFLFLPLSHRQIVPLILR